MAPHDHDHAHSHLDAMDVRVRALETLLTHKGYVDPAALDAIIETYETRIGPHNGAAVVARAWTEPDFRHWLLTDATAAIASMGFGGRQGEHMVAVENTPEQHNMVVCTLCSCYPWPILGLPPVWYKSAPTARAPFRTRAACCRISALHSRPDTSLRVWDSTAEIRYVVVPMRPPGTDGLDEAALAALVTRDSMIGTGLALPPAPRKCIRMNGVHDMGGLHCFGPVQPESNEPLFHAAWEKRALALTLAMGATGQWNIDLSRAVRESLPPAVYLGNSYYEIWIRALEVLMRERALVTDDELATGASSGPPANRAAHFLQADADVAAALASGSPSRPPGNGMRRGICQGDRVIARNLHPQGHTRLPRYVRGHTGSVVQLVHGAHLFADSHAQPQAAAI